MSKTFYEKIYDLLNNGKSCYTITCTEGNVMTSGHQMIVLYDTQEVVFGALEPSYNSLLSAELGDLSRKKPAKESTIILEGQEHKLFLELHIPPVRLVLIGGGHIAQAMAKVGDILGYNILVYDERKAFTEANLFPEGTKTICGKYTEMNDKFIPLKSDYAVILTHAHAGDYDALVSLADKELAYIGMIGSKTKVAKLNKRALEAGVPQEQLDKVFTPVGLAINAETVEEIAISIISEMIGHQRGASLECTGSCSITGLK